MNNPGAFEGCANPRAIEAIQQHIVRAYRPGSTARIRAERGANPVARAIANIAPRAFWPSREFVADELLPRVFTPTVGKRVHRRGWASMGSG